MAAKETDTQRPNVPLVRIFLSSPGDVAEERAFAREFIKNELPYRPGFLGQIAIELIAWDDPAARIPMLATETPQASVNAARPRPADCDIVIVILWSRMGTPLPDTIRKPDGTRYLSGTEWEYLDAVNSPREPPPRVLLYRRSEKPKVDLDDPDFDDKRAQFRAVEAFFARFRNPDGSLKGSVNEYTTAADFKPLLRQHLEEILHQLLPPAPPADATTPAAPDKPPVIPPAYLEWLRSNLERVDLLGAKDGRSITTAVRLGLGPWEHQLVWVERRMGIDVQQAVEAFAVHQVGADEAGEGERALHGFLSGLGETEEQEGDQGDGDLDAHGILGTAEKAGDLEGLFDPAEEQFDCPTAFVEAGNLFGAGVEVVRQDAQHLARLDPDADLADRIGERVATVRRLPGRQMADAVGEDRTACGHRQLGDASERRVGLEAGYDAAASSVHLRPPAVIDVAQVKDVRRTGLDRHYLGGGDVIDLGCGHRRIDRPVDVGIVDHMQLGAAGLGREPCPLGRSATQPHAGGIDQIGGLRQRPAQTTMRPPGQPGEQIGKDRRRPQGIGVGQRRPPGRLGTQVIKPQRVAVQPGLDLAQARCARKLRIQKRDQLTLGRQPPHPRVGTVSGNQVFELTPRNMLQQIMKDAIFVAHGVAPHLVSDERRQRSDTSRINTVHSVQKNPTGQPWTCCADQLPVPAHPNTWMAGLRRP